MAVLSEEGEENEEGTNVAGATSFVTDVTSSDDRSRRESDSSDGTFVSEPADIESEVTAEDLVSLRLSITVFLNLFWPRGTLGQMYQYLEAQIHDKIGLKVNPY